MSFNKIITNVIAITCCSVALSAQATPLTITNNTGFDSTTKIHNILNKCSSDLLGEGGITRAGKTNTVSEANIKTACFFSPNECVADVYATANCTGEIVATMVFSTTNGVISIQPRAPLFTISADKFNVTLNPVA